MYMYIHTYIYIYIYIYMYIYIYIYICVLEFRNRHSFMNMLRFRVSELLPNIRDLLCGCQTIPIGFFFCFFNTNESPPAGWCCRRP